MRVYVCVCVSLLVTPKPSYRDISKSYLPILMRFDKMMVKVRIHLIFRKNNLKVKGRNNVPLESVRAPQNRQLFAYAEEKVPPQAHFGLVGGRTSGYRAPTVIQVS